MQERSSVAIPCMCQVDSKSLESFMTAVYGEFNATAEADWQTPFKAVGCLTLNANKS